jgi:hypothetical protein
VFLTVDRNLSYQQELSAFDIAVVVMVAPGDRLIDLRPLMLACSKSCLRSFGAGPRVLAAPDHRSLCVPYLRPRPGLLGTASAAN